ncbi:MAG TPA: hypothetical protein VFR02_05960 [bacterium]|nr:hypothetical protein [bacterium]
MKSFAAKACAFLLVFCTASGSFPVQWLYAQTQGDAASADEAQELRHLAQTGYLGAKTLGPEGSSLTQDQVLDALLAIQEGLKAVDLKGLAPGDPRYQLEDLQDLLQMVEDHAGPLRDRKVSAWLYENRLKKMIAALTPAAPAPTGTPTAVPPSPTPTPVPGPGWDDYNALQGKLKDLNQRLADLQAKYDQKLQAEDSASSLLQSHDQERQDELKLVKNLMDTYESNLQKVNQRMDQVAEKADRKSLSDTELEQELSIMHKDLRDNTQDLTVLKQQVAQLDAPQQAPKDPLDDFLSSKWLAGGALVVGLAALTVALTHK